MSYNGNNNNKSSNKNQQGNSGGDNGSYFRKKVSDQERSETFGPTYETGEAMYFCRQVQKECGVTLFHYKKPPHYTHTLLTGGFLDISPPYRDKFFEYLARDLQAGRTWYINEMMTQPYARLAFDLDFEDERVTGEIIAQEYNPDVTDRTLTGYYDEGREMDEKYLVSVVKTIAKIVPTFFPQLMPASGQWDRTSTAYCHARCGVLLARKPAFMFGKANSPDKTAHRRILCRKTGVHLVWPELIVKCEEALEIREKLLEVLTREFPEREDPASGRNSWDEVVDINIHLKTKGLRLVYTDKPATCAECKRVVGERTNKKFCKSCPVGFGRPCPSGRPYVPIMMMSPDGIPHQTGMKHSPADARYLKCFSVRWPQSHQSAKPQYQFVVPEGYPKFDLRAHKSIVNKRRRADQEDDCIMAAAAASGVVGTSASLSAAAAISEGKSLLRTDPRYLEIGAFLRTTYADTVRVPAYRELCVDRVVESHGRNGRYYRVHVVRGPGGQYCQNVGREHSTATVHFYISQYVGCVQVCWSRKPRCPESKYNVPCSQFQATPVALPLGLQAMLFDDEMRDLQKNDLSFVRSGITSAAALTPGPAGLLELPAAAATTMGGGPAAALPISPLAEPAPARTPAIDAALRFAERSRNTKLENSYVLPPPL